MADLSKTVAIIFEGDDRVAKTLNELDTKFGALNTAVGSIAAPLASAADAVLKIDATLAALAIGGLAYAYKKSVEFETAMVGLKKVAGDSADTLDTARTTAFNLSAQYGESAAKVLNSTTDFVQAGYNVQESMALTKASMDLKIAGDIEAAQSSEMLISILKGFNAPATEATRVIDILNEVSNKYATDVEQLGLGMSKLAPIAKTMGFSFEETAGMLTPVIEVFRSGPEAADALKTGLLKLVDNTASVKDALASIGVSQTDANGALRSGKEILLDVSTAFQSLDQNQKLFVTQQLVGIEQSARMVQVFDNLGKVTEITGVAMNSAGSAAKEVAARMESSEVQIDRFKVGFENLGITIGDKFRESATKAITGGNEIMAAFSGLVSSGTFDPVFDALSGFSSRLYDYLKIIALNLPAAFEKVDFDGLLNAFGDLGDAFASWFEGIDLTTVDGLAEGLQTLVDIIAGLVELTAGMVEGFKPFVSAVSDFLVSLGKGDEESQKTLGTILALAKMVEIAGLGFVAAVTAVDQYKVSIVGLFNVVGGGSQVLWNCMQLIADAIQGVFVLAEGTILSFINKITFGLASLFPAFKDAQAIVEASGKKISANIDTDAADARRGLDRMIDGFNQLASDSGKSSATVTSSLKSIPDKKTLDLDISSLTANANKATSELFKIPDKKETTLTAKADTTQIESVKKLVTETLPDGTVTIHEVFVDEPKLAATKKTLDDALPKEKKIDASIETARIKAEADVITKAIEWKAKIDISQAEQATKQLESMLKSVDTGIDSTGDTLASLFKTMADSGGNWQIYDAIEKEKEYREQEFELQKKLVEQQLKLQEAKTKALESGSQVIQIEAAGLQSHLEMILWEILSAIQVRANEEAAEFLLGVKGA